MWQDTLVSTGLLPPILLNQVFVMVTNPNSNSFTQSPSILTFLTHRHLGHCLSSLSLLLNLPVPTHITLETIFSTSFRSCNLPGDYATPPCLFSSRAQHSIAPALDRLLFMSTPQEQQYEVLKTRDWLPQPFWPHLASSSGWFSPVACWQLLYFIYFGIIGDLL